MQHEITTVLHCIMMLSDTQTFTLYGLATLTFWLTVSLSSVAGCVALASATTKYCLGSCMLCRMITGPGLCVTHVAATLSPA